MNRRSIHRLLGALFTLGGAVALLTAGCDLLPPTQEQTIRLGGIFDLTGATSDVGAYYADAVRDCVAFLNAQGGIRGRTIQLAYDDYGYKIPQAEALYDRLVKEEHVVAVLGWGTGDTEALRPRITADRIPFMSASYAEELTRIEQSPYNFVVGVTYSDQMRIALRYIAEQWTDATRRPRVAFLYNDTPFGRSPIQDGRDYAAAHGLEVVAEEIIALTALDVSAQMTRLGQADPDYAIIQETANATAVILRDAHRLGLRTRFIGLNWAADEKTIILAGAAAEGMLGAIPFAFAAEDAPGIQEIREYAISQGRDPAQITLRYIQGWVTARVMAAGIERAGDDISGPGIKAGLETLTHYSTGGITAPVTFSSTCHKGTQALRIYQVQNRRWVPISDYMAVSP